MKNKLNIIWWAVVTILLAHTFGCKDKPVVVAPPVVVAQSDEAPDSLRFCSAIAPLKGIERAVGSPNRYWPQKKVLRIGFLKNPTAAQIEFLKASIAEVDTLINLSVTYPASGPYDQRWIFDPNQGSYSFIGTDCASIAQNQATGCIGWGWNSKNAQGVYTEGNARHEFLHSVGAEHEACSSNANWCWNKQNVYDDMAKQGWSKDMVDHNFFMVCDPNTHQQTAWDKFSVMQYGLTARWLCSGIAISQPQFLSETDKQFWSGVYKKEGVVPPPPPPGNITITKAKADSIKVASKNLTDMVNRILK